MLVLLVLSVSLAACSVLPGRMECPEGYTLLPHNSTCNRQISVGPADPASVKVIFPEVAWRLPVGGDPLTVKESECLSSGQIYWPASGGGGCHHLLSQGPCEEGHWLVLRGEAVVCRERLCPCLASMPDLCEVEVETGDCRCRVALAAAQEGLCDAGEQLLVSPTGVGVCGCVQSPPHMVWPGDGRCHALHSRGPCSQHFVLTVSLDSGLDSGLPVPVCSPALCGEDRVIWQDGECYDL